jgi:hypothetical protein
MDTPIIINNMNGRPVVGGQATVIRAAINSNTPVTITGNKATGDVVYLAPIRRETLVDDAITLVSESIAHQMTHPTFGEIIYAYVDETRMEQAPQFTELERNRRRSAIQAAADAERRAARMIPSCHNCGECKECC